MPTCKECGYTSTSNNFHTCQSPYHDLRCPKCQTTHINTTDLFKLNNTLNDILIEKFKKLKEEKR
ncbi:hypothetical protein LCGC14_2982410 [marine sediment metagenome]|uniref:Uncharacterized protein n=1 Tax=marine sediment metagenome TaxID=412755 RepID=A0A0F8ZXG7_9ZZZZ